MATAEPRGFVPWGEYTPDLRYLANDGLLVADGVIPIYGNYISSPAVTTITAAASGASEAHYGLFVDPTSGNGYYGTDTKLYELTEAGASTDRSKGGGYSTPSYAGGGWQGAAFGTNVVMTNYVDAVQYMVPGSPPFADMITSSFAPKARYVFPVRNNLFLGNCNLAGSFDTLASGAHPTLLCWSQSDNIRKYGSFNATPELTGAGYQELNFDIGEITGGIGGNGYGIVAHSNGISRVDGPPYQLRVLHKGLGCIYPNSLVMAGDDFYYFSPSGLTRIAGGDSAPEVIGAGKWVRTLIDNTTGAGRHPIKGQASNRVLDVSMAYDPMNGLLFIAYTSDDNPSDFGRSVMVYNINEDRASYHELRDELNNLVDAAFLRQGRQGDTTKWCPGRDIRFLFPVGSNVSYGKMSLGNNHTNCVLQRGYLQFSSTATSRVKRVRPIYNVTDQAAIEQVSVVIYSTNKPYATPTTFPTTGSYSTLDEHGFIVTPTTAFADFHSLAFTMTANANMHKVVEYEGFEYEVEFGAAY